MPSLLKRKLREQRQERALGTVELGSPTAQSLTVQLAALDTKTVSPAAVTGTTIPFVARHLANHLAVLPILTLLGAYVIFVQLGVWHPISLGALTTVTAGAVLLILHSRYELLGSNREVSSVVLITLLVSVAAGAIAMYLAYITAATATVSVAAATSTPPSTATPAAPVKT